VIKVYATTWCGDCRMAKHVLDSREIAYEYIDIDLAPEAAALVQRINGGFRTVPTILFPDGRVLVNDHPPNAETVGDAGIYFSGKAGVDDLARQLGRLLDDPGVVASYRSRALRRAREYSWEAITDEYEQLLTQVCEASGHGSLPPSMLDLELAGDQPTEPVSVAQKAVGLL